MNFFKTSKGKLINIDNISNIGLEINHNNNNNNNNKINNYDKSSDTGTENETNQTNTNTNQTNQTHKNFKSNKLIINFANSIDVFNALMPDYIYSEYNTPEELKQAFFEIIKNENFIWCDDFKNRAVNLKKVTSINIEKKRRIIFNFNYSVKKNEKFKDETKQKTDQKNEIIADFIFWNFSSDAEFDYALNELQNKIDFKDLC